MKTRRRLMALVMALIMVLSAVPAANAAVLQPLQNVTLTGDIVTWDAFEDAESYSFSVGPYGGNLDPDERSVDLKAALAFCGVSSGTYQFEVYAKAGGQQISEKAVVDYTYTSLGKLATPTNLYWDGHIARWDVVENATLYYVYLYKEGGSGYETYRNTSTNYYDMRTISLYESGNNYAFSVHATGESGYEKSDQSEKSAYQLCNLEKQDMMNVKITDGVLTWDAFVGAESYDFSVGPYGGTFDADERSIDLKAKLAWCGVSSGTYNVSLAAKDSLGIEISNKWTGTYDYHKAAPYTVTFKAESGKGSGTMAAVTGLAADASYTLPECGFTVADGLTFTGWNVTIGTADTVKKQPGETITVSDDVLLEAVIEDTRTVVKTFVATSDFVAPEYGDALTDPSSDYTYTFTQGAEGHLLRYTSSASWLKWDETESEWYNCDSEPAFTEGKYKINTQLRIDGNAGLSYKLPEDYSEISLTVDGQAWEVDDYITVQPTYSFVWVQSPEIEVEWKALPLTFTDSSIFDIGTGSNRIYKDKAITAFTVKNAVSGGVQPYTFSKVSGPEWLNVAADGTVSGTPTALGDNDDLVVRVTDSSTPAESREITITVGDAYLDPADREVVKTFVATTDMDEPEYGAAVPRPDYDIEYTFSEGGCANLDCGSADWEKWNEVQSDWYDYEEDSFTEGIYRIRTQLRIDGENGMLYRLPDDSTEISLTVDSQAWTVSSGYVGDTYSFVWVTSPSYLVTKPVGELVFMDDAAFDIGESYGNTAITSFSVASAVSGGTEPYTFSKVSGPEWLNVAADGTVSGTPTAAGNNGDLVVRVTDSTDPVKTKEITIDVGRTWPNPADRINVTSITATSDIYTPLYGEDVEPVEFEMASGSKARFAGGSMRGWYKQDGENWVQYTGETFVAGTYRYENTVIIDGNNGHEYKFTEPFTATVDGKAWTLKSLDVKNAQSTAIIYSPAVTVVAPDMINAATVTFDGDQLNAGCSRNLVLTVGDSAKYSATIKNWYEGGTAAAPGTSVGTGGTFEGGNTYVLELALMPAAGNIFAVDAPLTVNGQSAQYVEAVGDTRVYRVAFDVAEPINYIDNMTATFPEEIKAGASRNITPVVGDSSKYEISVQGWYEGGTAAAPGEYLDTPGTFVGGKTYVLWVSFRAKSGYEIADGAVVKINGKTALKVNEDSGWVDYRVAFDVAEDIDYINSMTATFPEELKGGVNRNITLTVGDSSKYQIEMKGWYEGGTAAAPGEYLDTPGTFENGKTYVLWVSFRAKSGYEIADSAVVKINGKTALKVNEDSGWVDYRVAFDAHKHTAKPVTGTPATCDEPGLTDGVQCSVCGDWIVTQEPIPKKGHTEKPVAGTPATCTKTGLTDGKKCSVCGVWTVKQEVIPKKAHTEKPVAGTPATCTKTGLTDGKKCSVCGTVTVKQEVIPKKAHTEKPIAGTPATCTKSGLTDGKKCSVCGTVTVKQQTILPVAHKYDRGSCTVCGEKDPNYVAVEGVDRVYGASRYETAFASADTLKKQLGVKKFSAAIVTSGDNFADALAGSYLAYVKSAPILLTDNDNIKDVMAYIQENVASGGTVYALGGKAVVTDKLFDLEKKGYDVKRLAGASRFETNLEILKECGSIAGKDILVCTGFNFADSLSASAAKRPILLVDDKLTDEQKAYLKKQSGCKYYIVGGTGAVTSSVEKSLKSYGTVKRLAGANRFDTSVMVAETFFNKPACAVLAYGYNFPDGLCAGPLAAAIDAPLILTATGDEAQAAAYAKEQGIKDGMALGGPALISDKAVKKIFSMGSKDKITVIN